MRYLNTTKKLCDLITLPYHALACNLDGPRKTSMRVIQISKIIARSSIAIICLRGRNPVSGMILFFQLYEAALPHLKNAPLTLSAVRTSLKNHFIMASSALLSFSLVWLCKLTDENFRKQSCQQFVSRALNSYCQHKDD